MALFSDSLIGICDALSVAMHASFVSKRSFSSQLEDDTHVIGICTSYLLKHTNWSACNYDAILTLESLVGNPARNRPNIIGALFLEKKDDETYAVSFIHWPITGVTYDVDILLLRMASEVVKAHGGKTLVHYIADAGWNHGTFKRYNRDLDFFWLDADGKTTNDTRVLSRSKKDDAGKRPCFKLC